MCRQLPNVTTIVPTIGNPPPPGANLVRVEPYVSDDTYDTLLALVPYSVPCVVDRLMDTRWMPDPRTEALEGAPVVGDVAYMILMEMGVPDLLPGLAHKKGELRMGDYFSWPSVGDHRLRLQAAVRAWLRTHPKDLVTTSFNRQPLPAKAKIRMSAADLAKARLRFSRLRFRMSYHQVVDVVGKPDAVDPGWKPGEPWYQGSLDINLLGVCESNRNEDLADIYFTERWTDDVPRRNPLRDRYVILFFSTEGKFTRMFSNVAEIPAIFPSSQALWMWLMWGEIPKKS